MRTPGILLLSLAVLAFQVAGHSQPLRTVYGAGLGSCGAWTQDRKADQRLSALESQWILGYISGVNQLAKTPTRNTDVQAITAWMDSYCAVNPLERLADAALVLTKELGASW